MNQNASRPTPRWCVLRAFSAVTPRIPLKKPTRNLAKAERVDRISFFVGSRLQNGPLCVRDFLRDSQRQRLPAAFGVWKFGNSYRDIGRVTVYDVTQEIVERSAALGEVRESFPFSSSIT
jgi:hypothetical protein